MLAYQMGCALQCQHGHSMVMGWCCTGAVPSSTCLPARYVWTLDLGADGAEQHRAAGPQGKVRRRRHSLRDARADRQIGKRNIEQRMAGMMQFRAD